jgi:hypothetical protein
VITYSPSSRRLLVWYPDEVRWSAAVLLVWSKASQFPPRGGVVAMGMVEVTTSHSRGIGKPELSPSLKAESSSLGDSSRMACSDGDPLWAIPTNTTSELFPSVNRP